MILKLILLLQVKLLKICFISLSNFTIFLYNPKLEMINDKYYDQNDIISRAFKDL